MEISEAFIDHEVHLNMGGRRVTVPILENIDTGEFVAPLLDHREKPDKERIVEELIAEWHRHQLPSFKSIREVVGWLRERSRYSGE